MYVCMYVGRYVCMYVWMCGCMDVWMDAWMDVCIHVCMDACGVQPASFCVFKGVGFQLQLRRVPPQLSPRCVGGHPCSQFVGLPGAQRLGLKTQVTATL